MKLSQRVQSLTFLALTTLALNESAIAESGFEILVDDGIWIEAPMLRHNPEGVLEVYVVINNRTSREIEVKSISANKLGEIQIVNRLGETVALPLNIPIHSELFIQPESLRIQVSKYQRPIETDSAMLSIAIDELDPVEVRLKYVGANEPLPDHHDYKHCESC